MQYVSTVFMTMMLFMSHFLYPMKNSIALILLDKHASSLEEEWKCETVMTATFN